MWDISTPRGGAQRARVTYQTGGITWWADYNLIFNAGKDANNGFVDLSAWVSIINQSGATYPDAKLKLIAGDVHRAPAPQRAQAPVMMADGRASRWQADAGGFAEKAFDEFHLYTLGRKTTLPNNSTKQIELFDQARQVPAKRLLVLLRQRPAAFGWAADDRPQSSAPAGNARWMPTWSSATTRPRAWACRCRLGASACRGWMPPTTSLEFIGEDVIDHTPRDEKVRVQLGSAFDVVGERKQVDFTSDITRALDGGGDRDRAAQPQGRGGGRAGAGEPVPLDQLEHSFQHPGLRQGRRAHHPVPGEGAEGAATAVRYRVRYSW